MFSRKKRSKRGNDAYTVNMKNDNQTSYIDIDTDWFEYHDFNLNADKRGSVRKTGEHKSSRRRENDDTEKSGSFSKAPEDNEEERIEDKKDHEKKKREKKKGDGKVKQHVTINIPEAKKKDDEGTHGEGEKDIYQLVIDGDKQEVVNYLENNIEILNEPNGDGFYLIHLAVMNNHTDIFQELLKMNADLSVVDADGKSVLHHAIIADSAPMVSSLLSRGVSLTVVDNSGMMPIHTAAELGTFKIMTIILPSHPNLNVKGEGGQTPLHIAAIHNQGNIIRLLMRNGASALNKDDQGTYPIHCAAINGATLSIEAIVEAAAALGIEKEKIMALQDREKNMPIHSAVISGNIQLLGILGYMVNRHLAKQIQTVKTCLKVGAFLNSQQVDGSTAVHLVAAQGLVEMARAMHEVQRELFYKSLNKLDMLKRTPLHWATLFNHIDMVQYLLDKGARINCVDVDQNTPLLIAASKGSINTLKTLIEAGAEPHVRDRKRRNLLHLLVLAMEPVPNLAELMKDVKYTQKLIKGKDVYGFTPLHCAAKHGQLAMFNDLCKLGSPLTIKSNKKQTILHLAAQFGRYKTCLAVLGKPIGTTLQNERDGAGMTPLHLAALCGQIRLVSMLLDKGVSVSKDNKNNTPLHLASSKGRVDCMKTLLSAHRNLLNLTNLDGNTALHLAAAGGFTDAVVLLLTEGAVFVRNNFNNCFYDEVIANRHEDVALAIIQHRRWQEVFLYLSPINGTFMIGLIKKLPDICLIVLDRCVTNSEHDPSAEDYYIEYNFTYLNLPENFPIFAYYNKIHYVPLLPLDEMVKNNRVELLSHPLCVNFLRMKWRKYGIHLHFLEVGLYFIYLTVLTIFVLSHDPFDHYEAPGQKLQWRNKTQGIKAQPVVFMDELQKIDLIDEIDTFCLWYIICYSVANLLKIVLMLILVKFEYISFTLLLELGVYFSALVFALPFLNSVSTHTQWEAAALCVFLSWFNCLVSLQRFDLFGIYVVMFMEILKTLFQVVMIFSVLNIAFGLAFYVLLSHESSKAQSTPLTSIYKTFMMLLEIDYLDAFNEPLQDDDNLTLHFTSATLLLLMVFLLFMPILLINLLIGLAVGDIEAVQREARLKRLATQVAFFSGAEGKLPFLRGLTEEKSQLFPNRIDSVILNAYNNLVGSSEVNVREGDEEEDSFVSREIMKSNKRLADIDVKLDKNIALMNRIMKRLHMSTEEEMWDEGGTTIEGIGEIEEIKTKKAKDTRSK